MNARIIVPNCNGEGGGCDYSGNTQGLLFFLFNGQTHGIWKLLGQGLNLSCNFNLRHSCGNPGSFNPQCQVGAPQSHTSAATQAAAVGWFFFFSFFGLPSGIRSSWVRDHIWATVATYATAVATLDPLTHTVPGQGSHLYPDAVETPPILFCQCGNFCSEFLTLCATAESSHRGFVKADSYYFLIWVLVTQRVTLHLTVSFPVSMDMELRHRGLNELHHVYMNAPAGFGILGEAWNKSPAATKGWLFIKLSKHALHI